MHRDDATARFRFALEKSISHHACHAAAEEGARFRAISAILGWRLSLPVRPTTLAQAQAEHRAEMVLARDERARQRLSLSVEGACGPAAIGAGPVPTMRSILFFDDQGEVQVPLHNTNGKSHAKSKSLKRAESGLPPAASFANTKALLFRYVTKLFYNSHIALVDDPDHANKLGDGKRPIDHSSCLILTRSDAQRIMAMVAAHRAKGVTSGNSDKSSIVYDSQRTFDMMVWGASGKGVRQQASFLFTLLKNENTKDWYLHHLEGVGVNAMVRQRLTTVSDDEPSDEELEESSFDYEDDDDDY